jgi:hypothetical protein
VLIEQAAAQLLDFSRVGHTPDGVMAWYLAKEGVLRCLHGTFHHSRAQVAEEVARQQAGHVGTMAALTAAPVPELPPVAPLPPPPAVLPAPAIPSHLLSILFPPR